MSNVAEGFYDGEVKGVDFHEDTYNPKAISVEFQVQIPGAAASCYHSTGEWRNGEPDDDNAKRFRDVLAAFGFESIKDLPKLAGCVGQAVRVRAKLNKKGDTMRFYIATKKRGETLDADAINRKLDAFTEDVPF